MYFAGVDLAWAGRNPTGVAVIDSAGELVSVGAVHDDDEILAALDPYVRGECLVAFDAPLVVNNPTGQRPAETALNRDFRRFQAGTHPCNTGKPEFADGPRAARLAAALGGPAFAAAPARHRGLPARRDRRPVRVAANPEIQGQARPQPGAAQVRAAAADGGRGAAGARPGPGQRKSELRRAEDPVDAVVCAYVALFAQRRPDAVTSYGDPGTGCIVTPSLPAARRQSLRSAPAADRSGPAPR